MDTITRLLLKRKKELLNLLETVNESMEHAPKGRLKIQKGKGAPHYYHISEGSAEHSPQNGHYIRKKDEALAKALAQKKYDKAMLSAIQEQLSVIECMLTHYDATAITAPYENLTEARRELVEPYILPDEEYVRRWMDDKYTGARFDEGSPTFLTNKGERVRSKSEVLIANKFTELGIPYKYEKPLRLANGELRYPDFACLNVRLRREFKWEHLGMMDDPSYVQANMKKLRLYEQSGIYVGEQLILSLETSNSFDLPGIEAKMRHYLL